MNEYEQMFSDSDDENAPLAKRKWLEKEKIKKIKKEQSSAEDHSSFVPSISSKANDQSDSKVIFSRTILINSNIQNIFIVIFEFTVEVGQILLAMSQRMCSSRGALYEMCCVISQKLYS